MEGLLDETLEDAREVELAGSSRRAEGRGAPKLRITESEETTSPVVWARRMEAPDCENHHAVTDLVDALEDTARAHILAKMGPEPSGELAAEPLANLVMSYGTWRSRLICPQPRTARLSAELAASSKTAEHKPALDAIVSSIEAGDDLRPHLSRRVKTSYQAGADAEPPGARRDRDLLIADWGIHHLHLSQTVESDGYVKRTGDLLFGFFSETDAFLIGIYPHGSWGLTEMLRILARNWPDDGPMHKADFAIGLTQKWSDRELLELRAAGIGTAMLMIDGAVWAAPALGQTLAGTPIAATQRSNVLMHTLREWREHLEERMAEVTALVNETAGRELTGDWEPAIYDDVLGIQRETFFFQIARLV